MPSSGRDIHQEFKRLAERMATACEVDDGRYDELATVILPILAEVADKCFEMDRTLAVFCRFAGDQSFFHFFAWEIGVTETTGTKLHRNPLPFHTLKQKWEETWSSIDGGCVGQSPAEMRALRLEILDAENEARMRAWFARGLEREEKESDQIDMSAITEEAVSIGQTLGSLLCTAAEPEMSRLMTAYTDLAGYLKRSGIEIGANGELTTTENFVPGQSHSFGWC